MARLERVRDAYPVTECDNCGGDAWYTDHRFRDHLERDLPVDDWVAPKNEYVFVENGLCLDFSGHYSGFTDDICGEHHYVVLCHDCSVAVARVLSGVFKPGGGYHSRFYDENETSCCEFAWTSDPDPANRHGMYVGDGKGNWVPPDEN